ncbi:hypothetical protein AQ611_18160 [Burkholderia singularis]|nr:hypothetical protein AQ611_18160 [Burkholderia sp. Bp7605]
MPPRVTRRRPRAAWFAPGGAFAFGAGAPDRISAARPGLAAAAPTQVRRAFFPTWPPLEPVAAARDATLISG